MAVNISKLMQWRISRVRVLATSIWTQLHCKLSQCQILAIVAWMFRGICNIIYLNSVYYGNKDESVGSGWGCDSEFLGHFSVPHSNTPAALSVDVKIIIFRSWVHNTYARVKQITVYVYWAFQTKSRIENGRLSFWEVCVDWEEYSIFK